MPNLGNAWHIPGNPEPRGRGAMRDPVGAIVPGTAITIFSGNQFQGAGGNPGNQLQTGSSLFFKRATDANWIELPMKFFRTADNNKYYSATIPTATSSTFQVGDVVQYYLRIAYDDHDTTFLQANGDTSTPTDNEAVAQLAPFSFTLESAAVWGQWQPVLKLPNVAIHTHVLPDGQVLMWGRRGDPTDGLDEHECTPFLWNPTDPTDPTDPTAAKTTNTKPATLPVNLFCSGHAFLPNGHLLVVGGHLKDGDGLSQARLYDWDSNTWTASAAMTTPIGQEVRRWYPTATSLPDGSILVLSGSYVDPTRPKGKQTLVVDLVQVWQNGTWKTIKKANGNPLNFIGLPLYPRMHVASDGRVFMSGTNDRTLLLKTLQPGGWTEVDFRAMGNRDYCPAVMYDVDKVMYIGGGNDPNTHEPTNEVEIIDLSQASPQWSEAAPMHFRRRQHNATILPDGTVLVTGGTRGGGGPNNGFNDLGPGQPVHIAELWNSNGGAGNKGVWSELAAEEVDRCYHATAVLLPDGRVLSAGGGEYRPLDGVDVPNDPQDSHRNAQVFSPPYLFKGDRPEITSAPSSVSYGEIFQVGTAQPNDIDKVSWVRLPSVTHSFDENQRINFLQFQASAGVLSVTAPNSANACPPGHYMLFILSQAGVPSIARIIQIQTIAAPAILAAEPLEGIEDASALEADLVLASPAVSKPGTYLQLYAREAAVAEAAKGTAVIVGVTGTCPYGIGACWGGAYEALRRLEGVDLVSPIPDTDDSTAEVFLEDERLPALDRWDEQFRRTVNGTYELRGVEVTLQGGIEEREGKLYLAGNQQRPEVELAALAAADKIQLNRAAGAPKALESGEDLAYERLAAVFRNLANGQPVSVTGPLKQTHTRYQLHVRLFEV
jgi:galactose oxidase